MRKNCFALCASLCLFILVFNSEFARAQANCSDLDGAVTVSTSASLINVKAGSSIQVPVEINIVRPEVLQAWNYVDVQFLFSNGIAGSNGILHTVVLKDQDGLHPVPTMVTLDTTAAMTGTYNPSILLQAAYVPYCFKKLAGFEQVRVEVDNKPETSDIHPPVLSNVQFKKSLYRVSEPLSIQFSVQDKSPICTEELDTKKICRALKHVEITSLDTGYTYGFEPFVKKAPGKDRYQVRLEGQSFSGVLPRGRYKVNIIDAQDIFGNSHAELPLHEQAITEINELFIDAHFRQYTAAQVKDAFTLGATISEIDIYDVNEPEFKASLDLLLQRPDNLLVIHMKSLSEGTFDELKALLDQYATLWPRLLFYSSDAALNAKVKAAFKNIYVTRSTRDGVYSCIQHGLDDEAQFLANCLQADIWVPYPILNQSPESRKNIALLFQKIRQYEHDHESPRSFLSIDRVDSKEVACDVMANFSATLDGVVTEQIQDVIAYLKDPSLCLRGKDE